MKIGLSRASVVLSLVLAGATVACGGGSASGSGATTTSSASMTPMEELKAVPKDLHADLEALTKPLDDLDGAVDELTSFPERHHVDAKGVMALAKARVSGEKLEISADLKLDEAAKTELEASLAKLEGIVAGLKATPDKAAALGKKAVEVSAKLPVMATRITTEANVKVSNPFADAASKASAQKDIADVQQVQADVKHEVDAVQAKVAELPGLAAKALTKLEGSFLGQGNGSAGAAKGGKAGKG